MKNSILSAKRKLQVKQGAYDGRYCPKVVKDRKKEASRRACQKNSKYF